MKRKFLINKNSKKLTKNNIVSKVAVFYTFFSIILLLIPLLWLLSSSLKDNIEIYKVPPRLVPSMPVLQEVDIHYDFGEEISSDKKEIIIKDAVMILWGVTYEYRNDNIQQVMVRVFNNNKLYMTSKIKRFELNKASREVMNTITYNPENVIRSYDKLFEKVDTSYLLNSNIKPIIRNDSEKMKIENNLLEKYSIRGDIIAVKKQNKPSLFLNNYISAWINSGNTNVMNTNFGFGLYIFNSVIVSLGCIIAQLLISSFAGYSLSKLIRGKLGKIILLFFLATMMIPPVATILPTYLIFAQLKLINTLWAVILPATSWGFAIFLFKGFFDNVPSDLIEAAGIDGAGELLTFVKIVAPLSKAIYGVIALWTFLSVWGDFMWPNIVLSTPKVWTFPVALYKLQTVLSMPPNENLALNVISMIPTLIILLIFQKPIQKGITFSGIKG